MNKELSKGSTGLLILSILSRGEMYGYQIIRELEIQSNNVFALKEGTLYPLLHTLEQGDLLEAYWEQMENGRRRKYYRITEKGRKELALQKEEWTIFQTAVNHVVMGENI